MYPLLNPKLFVKSTPLRSILLYGAPGNGKTMWAQAIASEIKWTFINIQTSVVMSKMYGESEKIMQSIFHFAIENEPWVLFFDEIDAILANRSSKLDETTKRLVSIFLQNVEGVIDVKKRDILIIGATNLLESMDPAVLRRFESRIEIKAPTKKAINDIISMHMSNVNADISNEEFYEILDLFEGYWAADIINIWNLVIKEPFNDLCTQDVINFNIDDIRPIRFKDFKDVIERVGRSYELSSVHDMDNT